MDYFNLFRFFIKWQCCNRVVGELYAPSSPFSCHFLTGKWYSRLTGESAGHNHHAFPLNQVKIKLNLFLKIKHGLLWVAILKKKKKNSKFSFLWHST